MALKHAIWQAEAKMKERGWDKIYVAVDWHDTICHSTYSEGMALNWCHGAERALKQMSEDSRICLILYTSSYVTVVEDFIRKLRTEHGINFEYFNCNPEVKNTEYGEFGKKFYYDLILDDKAGFVPDEWVDMTDWLDGNLERNWYD